MSYKTYTTEAIVCGSRANNTSDKSFLLFTRDAGMLWASAKSVREERSKQRFALQEFSLVRVSLVRGKNGWRIGSAESERNYFTTSLSKEARAAVAGIVKLLRQFLHGEMTHAGIFEDTKAALTASGLMPPAEVNQLIDLFAFRLLYRLGYVREHKDYVDFLISTKWWTLGPLPPAAARVLEKAKEASHL